MKRPALSSRGTGRSRSSPRNYYRRQRAAGRAVPGNVTNTAHLLRQSHTVRLRLQLDARPRARHLAAHMALKDYPHTPDGRYFVAAGKLRRCADPRLTPAGLKGLTQNLMAARKKMKEVQTNERKLKAARRQVNAAKEALGERGPVWWDDGAPDETLMSPSDSSYARWWASLTDDERIRGYTAPRSKNG